MHLPLDASSIVRSYDVEMRQNPVVEAGQRVDRIDGLVRTLGLYNMILFSRLEPADVDRVIARQVAYFSQLGEDVEWKLYAHDAPPTLASSLAAHGFEPGECETLVAVDPASQAFDVDETSTVDVRPVRDRDELLTYLEVSGRAFDVPADAASDFLGRLFGPGASTVAFVAYVDGVPAAAGRLDLPPNRSFASLWGGGTDPLLRGRGAYRALVAERARLARERGYRYLTVDALATSRPILERLGFAAIGRTTPWTLTASSPTG